MALDTFITGRYTTTYNTVDVGIQEEGFELGMQTKEDVIEKSDAFGDMIIDTIYRGVNWTLMFTGLAYKSGTYTPFYPFGALGTVGIISRLGSDLAVALVMSAVSGTPAAATPASLTATKSKLAENYDGKLLFNSRLRTVPIRQRFLPYDSGSGVIKHFTTA